jgi:hypothetical protein
MSKIRSRLFALVLALFAYIPASHGQGCGSLNPNCIVPTAPVGTSSGQAASTAFVQTAVQDSVGSYLPLSGGTMSGDIAMGGHNISDVGTVTATTYSNLPVGTNSAEGILQCDGTTTNCSGGRITAVGGGGGTNTQITNYTIATTDCGKTVQAGTGSTGLFTVTLPSVSGFASTCIVSVLNGDTGRGKTLSGFPSSLLPILWPQQLVQVEVINGAWVATINPGKWRPASAVQFNISTSGTDAGDCLGTLGCATLAYTQQIVCANVDPSALPASANQLVIKLAAGNYNQALSNFCDPGPLTQVGVEQAGFIKISGNPAAPGNVVLNCGSLTCFSPVHSLAGWYIEGIETQGSNSSIVADAGSHIYYGNMVFDTTGANAVDLSAAYGSLLEAEASFQSLGTKKGFGSANGAGSRLIFKPITITNQGTYTTYFYAATTLGQIVAPGASVTYSNAASVGTNGCYQVSSGGGLETDGGLTALTAACGSAGNIVVAPGWAN